MKFIASMLSWVAPGVGGVINPWVLLAIAAAAAVVFGAGVTAGWTANGWKLGRELADQKVELVTITAQAQICADKMTTQNAAVGAVGDLGLQLRKGTKDLLDAIGKGSAGQKAQIASLEAVLAKPPPQRPDGKPADCGDAWREIEKGRPKP